MSSPAPLLLFVHVPKASGSTIRAIISRNYLTGRTAFDEWQQVDFRDLAHSPDVNIIVGHFRFGMHYGVKRPVSYCSMIRNPIDRYVSDYYYAYSSPEHRLRDAITSGEVTLESFLLSNDPVALVRQLTGLDGDLSREKGLAETIAARSYSMIGVSERFDESVLLMAHLYGWAPPIYILKNKTRLSSDVADQRRQSRADLAPEVKRHFQRDLDFYDFCVARLDEAIALAGPGFAQALETFRKVQKEILQTASARDLPEMYHQHDFRNVNKMPPFVEKTVRPEDLALVEEFIAADSPLKQRRSALVQAGIDRLHQGKVEGWVLQRDSSAPVAVVIQAGGGEAKRVVADMERPDLRLAGFASSRHGYSVDVGNVNDVRDVSVIYEPLRIPLTPPPMMDGTARPAAATATAP